MVELRSQPNSLSLVNYPIGQWILSLALLGIVIVMGIGWVLNPSYTFEENLFIIIGATVCLVGIIYNARIPYRITIVDSETRTITLVKKSIFGSSSNQLSFDDVEGGAILDVYDDHSDKTSFSISLLLRTGKPVVLSESNDTNPGRSKQAVNEINKLLGMKLSESDFRTRELDIF